MHHLLIVHVEQSRSYLSEGIPPHFRAHIWVRPDLLLDRTIEQCLSVACIER